MNTQEQLEADFRAMVGSNEGIGMTIALTAIWYSGVYMGLVTTKIEGTKPVFNGHIHMFAKRLNK